MTVYLKTADTLTALTHLKNGEEDIKNGTLSLSWKRVSGLQVSNPELSFFSFWPGYSLDDIKKDDATGMTVVDVRDADKRRESAISAAKTISVVQHALN